MSFSKYFSLIGQKLRKKIVNIVQIFFGLKIHISKIFLKLGKYKTKMIKI